MFLAVCLHVLFCLKTKLNGFSNRVKEFVKETGNVNYIHDLCVLGGGC